MVGTWTLSEQWVEQDGKKIQRFGTNPKGIAIYDSNGRFATILLRTDFPKFASNNAMTGTPEENKAIVQGSNATYGTWSINEADGSLISKIDGSTFPGWDGQAQKRTLSIVGDEMKMCVPGAQIGGTACAIWKRAK
jgi:Lipocalin-like domain